MREPVIISAVRVPTGRFLGALKSLPATELGARVIREAVLRAELDPAEVDECIMGNVGSGRARTSTGAASSHPRGPSRSRSGADHQQGVRVKFEGGDAGGAGDCHR